MDEKKSMYTMHSMKPVAFAAIVLSTAAITACLVTFPLIFHYVQTLESHVQIELDFCKSRSNEMWKEMFEMQVGADGRTSERVARAAQSMRIIRTFAYPSVGVAQEVHHSRALAAAPVYQQQMSARQPIPISDDRDRRQSGGCCTCARGASGPPGQPGIDAPDGLPGQVGDIGAPGQAAGEYRQQQQVVNQCPCEAASGSQGPAGPRGQNGPSGDAGSPGTDGQPGGPGPMGPPGQPGRNGNQGARGAPGAPGQTLPGGEGPPGQPGRPGSPGAPGPRGPPGPSGGNGQPGGPGEMGSPGSPGNAGQPGGNGQPGQPGGSGGRGSCDHCAPARLAPGY